MDKIKKCTAIILAAVLAAMPMKVNARDEVSDTAVQTVQDVQFTTMEGTTIQYSSSVAEADVQELLTFYIQLPEALKQFFANKGIGIYLCNSWEVVSLPHVPKVEPYYGGMNDTTYSIDSNGAARICEQYIYVFADNSHKAKNTDLKIAEVFLHECGHFISLNSYCAKGDEFIYELADLDDFTNLATNYGQVIRDYAKRNLVDIPDGMSHKVKSEMFAVAFTASIKEPDYVNQISPELYNYVMNAAAAISN